MADERKLEQIKALSAYQFVTERRIEEMDSQGIVLEHKKSGARVFLMAKPALRERFLASSHKGGSIGIIFTTGTSRVLRGNVLASKQLMKMK